MQNVEVTLNQAMNNFKFRDAFENNFGVGILRNGNEGFDLSEKLLELNVCDITALKHHNSESANGSLKGR